MKELTDTILMQSMGQIHALAIIFPVILLLLALVIIIIQYTSKKKSAKNNQNEVTRNFKGYGYIIAMVIIVLLIGGLFFSVFNLSKTGKDSDWYVTIDSITRKYETKEVNDPGTRTTYYYVEVNGSDDVHVTKYDYDSLEENESVYVLRREDGTAEKVYSVNDYQYTGERLSD